MQEVVQCGIRELSRDSICQLQRFGSEIGTLNGSHLHRQLSWILLLSMPLIESRTPGKGVSGL